VVRSTAHQLNLQGMRGLSLLAVHVCLLLGVSRAFLNVLASNVSNVKSDNFCDDLVHGADEAQHSAACSGLTEMPSFFFCKGTTLARQRVFASRVDDGVCDCCDGSDEPTSGALCEDQCAALEAAERIRQDAKSRVRRNGLQRRAAALEQAQADLSDLKTAAAREAELLPGLDRTIADADAALADARTLAAARLEDRAREAEVVHESHITGQFADSGRAVLQRLIAALALRGDENVGEVMLKAAVERYATKGEEPDDAQVLLLSMETPEDTDVSSGLYAKAAGAGGQTTLHATAGSGGIARRRYDLEHLRTRVLLAADSLELMEEALGLGRLDAPGLLQVLNLGVMAAHHQHVLGLCLLDAGHVSITTEADEELHHTAVYQAAALATSLPPTPTAVRDAGAHATDAQQEQLQRTAEKARKEKEALRARSAESIAASKFDYGPHSFLYPLSGQCGSVFDKSYRYSVCPFKQAHQDNTLLGQYEKHESRANAKTGEQEVWLLFKGGAYCHATRRPREMHVRLECADVEKPALTDVSEYDVCVYKATLHTPVACFPDRDEF